MPDPDQSLKRLMQMRPADWLALIMRLLGGGRLEFVGVRPTDLAMEPPRVTDALIVARYNGVECAVNMEAQTIADATIGQRFYEYAARIRTLHRLRTLSIVFWLERKGRVPTSPHSERLGDLPLYDQHFVSIEVYNLQAADLLRMGEQGAPGLLPLVPFTKGGATLEAAEAAGRIAMATPNEEERVPITTMVGILAARKIGQVAANALVRRLVVSYDLLESSPLYQQWKEEWIEKNRGQWEQKAYVEGEARGEARGLRRAVTLALRGRFGEPDADLAQAIATADEAMLDDVILHSGSDSLEEIRVRFGL
ncbi:MAG TPA: hypothetical protein VMV29_01285 [Ktedonobacterales bacterium]|nr:hypothetical protein [Ktedonobacterales bacterium]